MFYNLKFDNFENIYRLHGIIKVMDAVVNNIAQIAPILIMGLFILPSYISAVRQRGFVWGLMIILILVGYSIAMIALAAQTGLPYGNLKYDSSFGHKVLGTVPWIAAAVYPTLFLTSFWLASKFTHTTTRVWLAGLFAVLMDVALDPAMVKLEFWQWDTPGLLYGVPLLSLAGRFLVALIAAGLLNLLWHKDLPVLRGIAYSGMLLLLFWSGVSVGINLWLPAAIGLTLGSLTLLLALIEKWKTTPATN